mgnify:CR=1 FL=1|jgi:predicted lactoylglutathione lyase
MTDRKVENTIPVLGVAELAAAIRFYTEILGFRVDWGGEEGSAVCSVFRDGCSIMLMADPKNKRSCVWIGMEDDTLFDEFAQNGAEILQEPTNQPWAYEMKILDVDGNILWLGTEPKS